MGDNPPMPDRIALRDLVFYGRHGSYDEEQRLGQRFGVTLELELDLQPAGRADDLDLTVDYGKAIELARDVVEGPPARLTETVAERIAERLLETFQRLQSVRVIVTKIAPPVASAVVGTASIDITRHRAKRRSGG
jgi:dihydroneopterin aldolase